MGWRELGNSDIGGGLVGLEGLVGGVLALVTGSELGEVTVVVSHPNFDRSEGWDQPNSVRSHGPNPYFSRHSHLVVEHLALTSSSGRNEVLVKNIKDVLADLGELSLDLLPVTLDHSDLSLVTLALLFLLDRGDDSPRSTTSTDDVLVGDGEEVSLFDGELLVGRSDGLHVLDHF